MVKFPLALILFTAAKLCDAQSFHFADSSSAWSEGSGDCSPEQCPAFCQSNGWRFELWKDTIINGRNYQLVGFQLTYEDIKVFKNCYLLVSDDPYNYAISHPGNIIGAIREDSSKKVWFRALKQPFGAPLYLGNKTFPVDSDEILYDFNLQAGDTVQWQPGFNIIDTVDSIILLDGKKHKEFTFKDGYNDVWIEGIGSVLGLFGSYSQPYYDEGIEALGCFHEGDSLIYQFYGLATETCDRLYTGIPNITTRQIFDCFPSIASSEIHFRFSLKDGRNTTLIIYNSTGALVKTFAVTGISALSVPVNEVGGNGFYFAILRSDYENNIVQEFSILK